MEAELIPKGAVRLSLTWDDGPEIRFLARERIDFAQLQEKLVGVARQNGRLPLNMFFYAGICPAKNLDLIIDEDFSGVDHVIDEVQAGMRQLERFERGHGRLRDHRLRSIYLGLRRAAARGTARDERRALASLLFRGPSTTRQIASDLSIHDCQAVRVLEALGDALDRRPAPDQGDPSNEEVWSLRTDSPTLAAVLYLLRCTLGLDPIAVLGRLRETSHA